MRCISQELAEGLQERLPEAYEILARSNLTIHDAVRGVILTGSRGLKGGYRPDSDIDLSLLVAGDMLQSTSCMSGILGDVIDTTLSTWRSPVELDTVAVFDRRSCGLVCFETSEFATLRCGQMRPDCVGLYKTQKGFNGFVPDIGITIEKVYPMMSIWRSRTRGGL